MLPQPFVIVAVAALVLAVVLAAAPKTRRSVIAVEAAVVALVVVLALVAAWPILDLPFETDAPVQRAAFAAVDVFGDWNHPFLSYLLNRPATWISLSPQALRILPLAFLLLETALTAIAAIETGGPLAGALAGSWFVCEIRRRHGLIDLGDWDFAGAFLMALVVWSKPPTRDSFGRYVVLAVLLAAGVFSSWLMVVPATVMVACVLVEARLGRTPPRAALLIAVVWLVLAGLALRIFVIGALSSEPGHAQRIFEELWLESPLAREPLMIFPLAVGALFAVRRFAALRERFALLSSIAVPAAVCVAFRTSHVNGGYYAGLATPLACYLAGIGTGAVINGFRAKIVGERPTRLVAALGLVAVAALVGIVGGATIDLPGPPEDGLRDDPALFATLNGDPLPIYTNSSSVPRLLAFERAREKKGSIADVLAHEPGAELDGPADLVARTRLVHGTCEPNPLLEQGSFYFVGYLHRPGNIAEACAARLSSRCRFTAGASEVASRVLIERCD